MEVTGYKAFTKDYTGEQNFKFEEKHLYHLDGRIIPGNRSYTNGFHFCKHLSDVFRFYPERNINECNVARVIGYNNIVSFDINDWTYPYEDLYATSDIYIDKFLTRDEVINLMLNASESDVCKFLIFFTLSKEEIELFINKFSYNRNILRSILFYQLGEKDIYISEENYEKAKRRILK